MNTDHSQTQASPMQDMGNGILLENQESAHWSTYHGRTLLSERLTTFQMDQGDGRVQLLMAIPGVVDCSVQRYSVHVRKSPAFSWNEIHPAVLAAMDQFQSVSPQDKRLSKQSLLSRIRFMQTEVECDFGYAIDPHAGPNQVKGKGDRMNQLYGQWHALGKLAFMIERDLIGE